VQKKYSTLENSKQYLEVLPFPDKLVKALDGLDFLIYGGYVRDLIAKKHNQKFREGFKDIDICLLWESHNVLINRLAKVGYRLQLSNLKVGLYSHWGAVSRCYTLLSNDRRDLPIQIVVPNHLPVTRKSPTADILKSQLLQPIQAVDIRCCGVAITPSMKLIEVVPGAVNDCKAMKIVESLKPSHKKNIEVRTRKLRSRGWSSDK
jgi:hypothetical protein